MGIAVLCRASDPRTVAQALEDERAVLAALEAGDHTFVPPWCTLFDAKIACRAEIEMLESFMRAGGQWPDRGA